MKAPPLSPSLFRPPVAAGLAALAMLSLLGSCSTGANPLPARSAGTPSQSATSNDAGEGYVLGADDQIVVSVWRQDDLKTITTVDPSGNIDMPLVGKVKAGGLAPSELAREIESRMAAYLHEPKVSVAVTTVASRSIYVLGEVKMPGMYAMSSNMNTWEAVAKAGGFSLDADTKRLIVVRDKQGDAGTLAVAEAFKIGSPGRAGTKKSAYLPRLQNRDIVYVPTSGIATVANFMSRLDTILRPILSTASVIVLSDSAYDVFFPQAIEQGNRPPGESIAISP